MTIGFVDIFLILLVVAGPTKALAFFAAKAGDMDRADRRAVAIKSVVTATIILVVFALLGNRIIEFFHVSIPALEIAGGAILFVFALQIVLGEGDHDHGPPAGTNIAVYPMAMPLMASPQAIVAIVVVLARLQDVQGGRLMLVAAVLATMAINLAALWALASAAGKPGAGKSSSGAAEVLLRVVAIMLAGLAVQLMILGFRDLGVLPPAALAH